MFQVDRQVLELTSFFSRLALQPAFFYFFMDEVIYFLKVIILFDACICGVLLAFFVMLALKIKDLI